MFLNIILKVSPTLILLTLCAIPIAGFFTYLLPNFDLTYKYRNKLDFWHATLLIMLPTAIGLNARYYPKNFYMHLFYFGGMTLMTLMWPVIFYVAVRFVKVPIQRTQITTRAEIIENKFRLSGTAEVFELISHDKRVRFSF